MASWIEIEQGSQTPSSTTVEAYVASWIEIQTQRPAAGRKKSRLMWPRGLKCILYSSSVICSPSRLMWPRGLKFSPYHKYGKTRFVEAYVASWIEILTFAHRRSTPPVEAYTASWIEIIAVSYMTTGSVASRLIRPYGLK